MKYNKCNKLYYNTRCWECIRDLFGATLLIVYTRSGINSVLKPKRKTEVFSRSLYQTGSRNSGLKPVLSSSSFYTMMVIVFLHTKPFIGDVFQRSNRFHDSNVELKFRRVFTCQLIWSKVWWWLEWQGEGVWSMQELPYHRLLKHGENLKRPILADMSIRSIALRFAFWDDLKKAHQKTLKKHIKRRTMGVLEFSRFIACNLLVTLPPYKYMYFTTPPSP